MKKRFDITYFFLLTALFFSGACIFKQQVKIPPQTLRVGFLIESMKAKDSACEFSPCLETKNLTGEGLFRIRYQNNRIVLEPTMAESWSFSKDNSLKIVLKKNLKTSTGTPISASDFVKSWEKVLQSKNIKEAHFFFPIVNARAFFENQVSFSKVGIKVLDPLSISLSFSKSSPDFIYNLSHPSTWLNPLSDNSSWGSAGPFFQVPSGEANKIKLVRNPNYCGENHSFESIELIKFFDPTVARNSFEDKELNILSGAITGLPNTNKVFLPTPTKYLLNFNTKSLALAEAPLRQALIESIDKTEWLDLLHLNLILISKLDVLFEKDGQPNSFYNPTKAKDIISMIKKENESTIRPKISERKPLILLYPNELEPIATNLKMQWLKNLGLQIETVPKAINSNFSNSSAASWDLELLSTNFYPHSKPLASESYFPLFSAVQIISELSKLKGIASNPWGGLDLSQGG